MCRIELTLNASKCYVQQLRAKALHILGIVVAIVTAAAPLLFAAVIRVLHALPTATARPAPIFIAQVMFV